MQLRRAGSGTINGLEGNDNAGVLADRAYERMRSLNWQK